MSATVRKALIVTLSSMNFTARCKKAWKPEGKLKKTPDSPQLNQKGEKQATEKLHSPGKKLDRKQKVNGSNSLGNTVNGYMILWILRAWQWAR